MKSTMSTIEQVKAPAGGSEGGGIAGWWRNTPHLPHRSAQRDAPGHVAVAQEVYATTVVVILTSAFFGFYLWGLDLAIDWAVNWILPARYGAA